MRDENKQHRKRQQKYSAHLSQEALDKSRSQDAAYRSNRRQQETPEQRQCRLSKAISYKSRVAEHRATLDLILGTIHSIIF